MTKKTKTKKVKKEYGKPCGCYIIDYDDGSKQISPCVPCGLVELGHALTSAGQITKAIATRILNEQKNIALMEAAEGVMKAQGKKVDVEVADDVEQAVKGPQGVVKDE